MSQAIWRFILFFVLALGFVYPVFFHPTWLGGWDQTYFHAFDETARRTLLDYGQFPLWNPYHCGGRTLVGHVANLHLHPLFWLLALPLGTAIAYKFYLLLHIIIAMAGMDRYLRERGADPLASIFGAVVFGACGYFSWHFAGGHISYYGLTLTPWILICLDRARYQMRYGVWVGLLLAWTFLMGGPYAFPFQVLLVVIHVVGYSIKDRSWRIFWAACIAGVVCLGVAAIKFGPVLDFTLRNPRPVPLLDSTAPWEFFEMLLSRGHSYGTWPGHPWPWPEYGNYIGYIALFLAFYCLVQEPRKRLYFLVMALVFASICLGKQPFLSPAALLKWVPIYKDLRLPSRYMIFVVFYLTALAAFGFTLWRRRFQESPALPQWPRLKTLLPFIIAAIGMIEVLSYSSRELYRTYNIRPLPLEKGEFFQDVARRPQIESYLGPYRNRGIVNCYEEAANPRSRHLRKGQGPQVFLENPRTGSVKMTHWTPNALRFKAELTQPAVVIINQNHDPNWQVNQGQLVNKLDLLAVRLNAGAHEITVRYLPLSFKIGAVISLFSILLIIFWLFRLPYLFGKMKRST